MCSSFIYLLLGIIQGLTEFLPVSSSGHLTLLETLFGLKPDLSLNVFLHMGTLIAVFIFFWRDIYSISLKFKENISFLVGIVVMTLVTALIGLPLKLVGILENPHILPITFSATTLALALTPNGGERVKEDMSLKDALLIGLAQGFAVIPGISRSGFTIITALALGFKPDDAFKISFIGGIPAILGAFLIESKEILGGGLFLKPEELLGFISALVSGILALELLRTLLKERRIRGFWVWTGLLAVFSLISLYFWKH